MQKPSSHSKVPGSSSSTTNPHSSNRHRSDRGERHAQSNTERINFPTAQRSSGSGSNSMPSMSRSSSSSGMGQARPTSASTHDANNYPPRSSDPNKQRVVAHPHGSGQSSHQRGNNNSQSSSSASNKIDQRHLQQREQKMPSTDTMHKGMQKPSPSNSNAMYPTSSSSTGGDPNRSSTSSRHPSTATGHSQSAGYSKNVNRSSMQPDQTSVQSQSQLQAPPPQSQPMKQRSSALDTSASYRLTDDITSLKSLDSLDLISSSPPKQLLSTQSVKAPSIFSPEWGDTKAPLGGSNGNTNDDMTASPKHDNKLLINPDSYSKSHCKYPI